ncbi:MAG TPA: FAD-binding oxidoreductase, partial [Actinomycetota bacterium]
MRLTGKILWRGEPGYEEARLKPARAEMDWNARRVDRYPDAVVRATSDQDVVAAVRLARQRGLKVKARSGGHSWVDASIRDGGILVDLSQLDEVVVDPETRTAWAGPGVKSQELFPHLKPHGLCFPSGFPSGGCRDVGLGGYVLQGGFGFNGGRIGLAAMNVLAMDVVTAGGELVRADETTNPDLFWAARGSGSGFFGIVTRFHLRLHPLPGAVRTRAWFFSA